MKNWHPLDGDIPPDPPGAPWQSEPGDSPAAIITSMRKVWQLAKGGTPEHAQALFEKAGPWLDYWRQHRVTADQLDLAGIRVHEMPPADAPDNAVAPGMAILAIYAAHQAILTGRRAMWVIAIELSRESRLTAAAIDRESWIKAGGKARKGKPGPLRLAVEMLTQALRSTKVEMLIDEMRRDANGESEAMDDIRGGRSQPVDINFVGVPESADRKSSVRYTTAGAEKSITCGRLANILAEIRVQKNMRR